MSTYDAIYAIVRQIPFGKVATYGQVADLAQLPGQARLVGYALYRVDMQSDDIPWHRVINAKGEVSESPFRHGTDYLQRSLLEQEGVVFNQHGKVSLRQYRWQPDLHPGLPPEFYEGVAPGALADSDGQADDRRQSDSSLSPGISSA